MSLVRVLQISELLETYMIVNFRTRGISRNTRKVTRIPILMKIISRKSFINYIMYDIIILCREYHGLQFKANNLDLITLSTK
jgi:hypothetical protein